jgi:hypothetical protein
MTADNLEHQWLKGKNTNTENNATKLIMAGKLQIK